ncbi:MAG: hypothetical protein OXE49_19700, partial [Gemmatimonadetes bacterium]|nr:hypothetical protein [Gemmatimonadota bacterium]
VELPIIEAKVLGEVSNLSAPYKFATLNPTVRGTLTEDRLPAVRGVLDEEPELVPIKSVYAFPSGGTVELAHRMPARIDPYTALNLVANAIFFPLANRVDNDPDHSIRVATDISFVGSDSTLARSRLYSTLDGRLLASIFTAYGDVSDALAALMTRNDYVLQVREAAVQVEVIPETRFATVAKVTADSAITLGSTLDITTSLRVRRTEDREVELALSVPDTLPPGLYQLEVGSVALLGDAAAGDDGSFLGLISVGNFGGEGEETLDDVFARLNKPDENVLLQARLTFVAPPEDEGFPAPPPEFEGEGSDAVDPPPDVGGDAGDDFLPPGAFEDFLPPDLPEPISTQEDVGLYLEGIQILAIEVVAEEEVEE